MAITIVRTVVVPYNCPIEGYFVDGINGDNGNDGSFEYPWQTIQYGVNQISAGDTLYIREGTYIEKITITVDGTEANPIVVSGYPGETVIIDGDYSVLSNYWEYLLFVDGDYVTVRDFQMIQSNGCMLLLNGTHDYAINIDGNGSWESGMVLSGSYNTMDGCSMTDSGNGYPVHNPTWGNQMGTIGSYCTIENCYSYANPLRGEGFGAYGTANNITLKNNIAYNKCIYIDSCHDILVDGNLIYYDTDANMDHRYTGIALGCEVSNPYNLTIINNLVAYAGLNLDVQNCTEALNWIIANNTFVNTQKTQADIDIGYNMSLYFRVDLVSFSGSVFEDNIIIEEDSRITPVNTNLTNPHAGFTFDYNCWNKTPTAAAQGANDVVDDPEITKEGGDWSDPIWFKLQSTSPARGAGLAIDEVTDDYWGTPRSDPPDMGAHEYT